METWLHYHHGNIVALYPWQYKNIIILGNNQFWMYRKDRRIMGLLYVFDVDGLIPGSHVILVWINLKSDRQYFDYNTRVDNMLGLYWLFDVT